jgi:hypothetical protein
MKQASLNLKTWQKQLLDYLPFDVSLSTKSSLTDFEIKVHFIIKVAKESKVCKVNLIKLFWCKFTASFLKATPWTNFILQDEPWAEFSSVEVAACKPWPPITQCNNTT